MKSKKLFTSFLVSLVTMMLCLVSFAGTTLAWFTDTVSNTGNKIQAGTLDVGLDQYKKVPPEVEPKWVDIEGDDKPVFNSGEDIALWEPGYSQYGVFRITNKESNLAFKYKLKAELKSETIGKDGQSISDVIDVYTILLPGEEAAENVYTNATTFDKFMEIYNAAVAESKAKTSLKEMMSDVDGAAHGILVPTGLDYSKACLSDAEKATIQEEKAYAVVVLHMQESAGNEYQGLDATFDIKIEATQVTIEKDGFGACTYDAKANGTPDHPEFDLPAAPVVTNKLIIPVNVDENNTIKVNGAKGEDERTVTNGDLTTIYTGDAIISDGTELANDKKTSDATTGFEYKGDTPRGEGLTITSDQAIDSYDLTLNVSNFNDKLIKNIVANYPAGRINLKAFHKGAEHELTRLETEELPATLAEGTEYFYYNEETGKLVFWVFNASPVEFVYDVLAECTANGVPMKLIDAINSAEDGKPLNIKLNKTIYVKGNDGIKIEKNKNIILDLDGWTIIGQFDEARGGNLFKNEGTLTIKDTSKEKDGKLTDEGLTQDEAGNWHTDPKRNYADNVVSNYGVLNLESGTIEQGINGNIVYCVDNYSGATFNMTDGHLYNWNTATVRMFCNSTTGDNIVNISGGLIEGYQGVWVQNPSGTNDSTAQPLKNVGHLNISGGTFDVLGSGTDAIYSYEAYYAVTGYGDPKVYYDCSGININITGGIFNSKINVYKCSQDPARNVNLTVSGGSFIANTTKTSIDSSISLEGGYYYYEPSSDRWVYYNFGDDTYKAGWYYYSGDFIADFAAAGYIVSADEEYMYVTPLKVDGMISGAKANLENGYLIVSIGD